LLDYVEIIAQDLRNRVVTASNFKLCQHQWRVFDDLGVRMCVIVRHRVWYARVCLRACVACACLCMCANQWRVLDDQRGFFPFEFSYDLTPLWTFRLWIVSFSLSSPSLLSLSLSLALSLALPLSVDCLILSLLSLPPLSLSLARSRTHTRARALSLTPTLACARSLSLPLVDIS